MTTPTYDPALSLTANLSANGYSSRTSPLHSRRWVFEVATGETVGCFDDLECETWLKERVCEGAPS